MNEICAVFTARRKGDSKVIPTWVCRTLISALLIMYCVVTYWLFWPYTPFVIDGPIRVTNLNRQVVVGEYLDYEKDVEKKLPVPATIYKWLMNDYVIAYTPITGNIPVGKRTMRVKLKIPQSAEPGIYKFKWEGHYQVNPIRTVIVIGWSEPFEVVSGKTKG